MGVFPMPNPFRDVATFWTVTGDDGFGGLTFGAPVQVSVRWEDIQEDFLNPQGEIQLSKAVVYCPRGTAVKVKDYVLQGTSVETDPTTVQDAELVRQVLKSPDLRAVKMEVRVIL